MSDNGWPAELKLNYTVTSQTSQLELRMALHCQAAWIQHGSSDETTRFASEKSGLFSFPGFPGFSRTGSVQNEDMTMSVLADGQTGQESPITNSKTTKIPPQ